MLASVLPGFRDLRAPLAAGYLWLLAGWLLAEPHLPDRSEATGPLGSLLRLEGVVSAIGVGIALSFAAYLVGSISLAIFDRPLRAVEAMIQQRTFFPATLARTPPRARLEIREAVQRRVLRAVKTLHDQHREVMPELDAASPWAGGLVASFPDEELRHYEFDGSLRALGDDEEAVRAFMRFLGAEVARELPSLKLTLIGTEPDLFTNIDRYESEAELRFSITPPLIALLAALAVQDGLAWLAGLLGVALLWYQGVRQQEMASEVLANALSLGRIESPILRRFDASIADPIYLGVRRGEGEERRAGPTRVVEMPTGPGEVALPEQPD